MFYLLSAIQFYNWRCGSNCMDEPSTTQMGLLGLERTSLKLNQVFRQLRLLLDYDQIAMSMSMSIWSERVKVSGGCCVCMLVTGAFRFI